MWHLGDTDSDWFGSAVLSCVFRKSGHYISYLSEIRRSGACSNKSKQLLLQLIAGYKIHIQFNEFCCGSVPSLLTKHT